MNTAVITVYLAEQRRFPRRLTSVGASRDFVTGVLVEWELHPLIEDIKLCVSELATNALLHGVPPGREFCVGMRNWYGWRSVTAGPDSWWSGVPITTRARGAGYTS